MPIKYRLYKSNLKGAPDAYVASVKRVGTLTEEHIVMDMVERRRTPWPATQCLAFLEEFWAIFIMRILEGYHINTPLMKCVVSMEGQFDGPKDHFNKKRHTLKIKLSPGRKLREAMKDLPTPEKY